MSTTFYLSTWVKLLFFVKKTQIEFKPVDTFQVEKVDSVVEWLKRRARDQHGLGSKPTRVILLCTWERHFTALFPAWWSWQAVLNYSY